MRSSSPGGFEDSCRERGGIVPPAWQADIDIDAPLAERLVREQFPELGAATVEPFGLGWDNAAFLVDARLVFRFPRRRIAAALIEREIAMLPLLAPSLPLAIPAPTLIGVPAEQYPWPFAGYERIPGTTGCSVALSDDARVALAEPLALFLRALHAVDPEPLVARGLPPDRLGRLDHGKRVAATRERVAAVASAGVPDAALFFAWLQAHPPALLDDRMRRVVHGDLYARHVLLNDERVPSGVIDWGDIHFGDPGLDLAVAHLMLPAAAHRSFRAAYGKIDERTWRAARYRAVYHAFLQTNYGVREGDVAMRAAGVTALRLIRPCVLDGER